MVAGVVAGVVASIISLRQPYPHTRGRRKSARVHMGAHELESDKCQRGSNNHGNVDNKRQQFFLLQVHLYLGLIVDLPAEQVVDDNRRWPSQGCQQRVSQYAAGVQQQQQSYNYHCWQSVRMLQTPLSLVRQKIARYSYTAPSTGRLCTSEMNM